MYIQICFLLFVLNKTTSQRHVSADEYVAAVVEMGDRSTDTKWTDYAKLIAEAASLNADIILFPEMWSFDKRTVKVPFTRVRGHGNSHVPALRSDLYDEGLVLMSKAARKNSIYVVVNYHELLDCTQEIEEHCPEQKTYVFNTNVVFDRNGSIILRYRKNNLFYEPDVTPSFEKGPGVFHTDFGVTFALFISNDLLNPVSMEALGMNLKNMLVNVYWVTVLPFLTAVQTHESFAYGMNVNLLVSGFNNANRSASGSGIYSGKAGSLLSFITGVSQTKLLVSRVPKSPGKTKKLTTPLRQSPKDLDGLTTLQDPSLRSHVTVVLIPGYQEFTLEYKDIICRFKIDMKERDGKQKYKYRAGAFSGVSLLRGGVQMATRDCAVFSCAGNSTDTCGKRFLPYTANSTSIFKILHIEGTTPAPVMNPENQSTSSTFYPSTLDVSFLPLEPEDLDYFMEEKEDRIVHSLSLKNVQAELYTFALWGRQYDRDGEKLSPPFEEAEKADIREMDDDEKSQEDRQLINDQREDVQEDNDAAMVLSFNTFEGLGDSSLMGRPRI